MKITRTLIAFLILVFAGKAFAVTIVSDGLNNSTSLFTLSGGAYYTGNSATGDRPASSAFASEGTHSRGISSGTATLTSSDINTSSYTSIALNFSLASFSIGSTGNGADAGDIVTVEISPDGGTNYYSTVRVLGNANAYWAYSATGIASTAYDGNATPVDYTPSGGGSRTTDGFSTVTITGLPATTNMRIRITLLNNSANERWTVDNVIVTGTIACTAQTITAISPATITKTYGDATYSVATTATSGLTVTYASSNTGVATVDASGNVTIVSPGTVTITASQAGNGTYCAATNVTQALTVNPKTLTITGLTANNKVYDGNTTATLSGTATLVGIIGADVVTLGGSPTANFSDAAVGVGKTVTVTGYTLGGAAAAKYTLTQPTLTADITAPAFSITTTAASYGPYCNGIDNSISVSFTPSGAFTGGFYVQLSNTSGVFPSNSTSNLISSVSATSPITATIPLGQTSGTGYRVRVVNQSESTQSTNNNGSNIAINTTPITPTCATPSAACQGNTVTITGAGSTGATTYTYWTASSGGSMYTTGSPTGYTVSGGNLTTPNSLVGGTYDFYVQGENAALCSSLGRQKVTITINGLPSNPANPTAALSPSCGATTLNTMSVPGGETYYWQGTTSNGSITNLGNATSTYAVTSSGTYYVRSQNSNGCWSAGRGSVAVTIQNGTTSIAPTATQNILTTANGTTLTVTEGSAITSRRWMASTTSGSGYIAVSPSQTNTTYIPNFTTAGTYYVICETTYPAPCGVKYSNEVVINVTNPGPPIISHTLLSSTTSTAAQTAIATITTATAFTCTPSLTYRIDGASWATPVTGTNPSGNVWNFVIPGQVAGTLIEYFITACNVGGTVTSPSDVSTASPYGSFNEYAINCTPASSGTQTIAYQGFEFVGSSGYTFSVDNTNTAPTGAQNYPAHASAVEWNYYNKGVNGSLTATNRNSCNCMAETYSGFPAACPDAGNPVYPAGGSTGFCRTFSGNSRGVYLNTSASTENPTGSRSRNGSYSYIQQSRADGGISPMSYIYFDDIAIPDATNATNIKVIAYVSSISTSTLSNGAESADFVELNVKYNSTNSVNSMVPDPTCGSDLYFFSSSAGSSVAGTTNLRWDFAGNTWNTTPAISGTTTKNKITISVPNGTTNVRALIRMLNDDAANSELWAVDDIQIIADYPVVAPSAGRYYKSKQNGKWENVSTWEVSTTAGGSYSNACEVPTYTNSDSIIIQSGDTVQITANQTLDQLRVLAGGKLILKNVSLTFNDQSNSTDFLVDGTFEDNATSGSGISFNSGAKWKYSTGATIIKTNTSAVTTYRDNYEGGISSIPTNASWYFRYNGGGNPVTTAVGMFYPTLYFENTANTNNFSFNSFSMAFTGSTGGFCTVKGDLNIGTTGTGSVTVYNNNLNSSPMLVNGNINVAANSTLSNQFCPTCGSADGTTTGDGTGFEVKGNVTVNGTFDVNNSTNTAKGLLKFSGTGTQTVSGNGTFDLYNVEIAKTALTILDQQVDLTVVNNLNFTGGIVKTNANTIYVSNTSTSAITGGNTSGSDKYVQGRLKRKTDGASTYTFPIGHSAQNAQGFTITPTGTSGSDLLGYLETNSTTPVKTVAYCDLETKTAPGQQIGQGSAGADGALDQVVFNLASPLQWDITNPGGGITSYNVTVNANGGQDINPVTSASGTPIRYLLKNGEPGNTGFTTASGGADYPTVGFIACPNQYTLTGMTSFSKFTVNGANAGGTGLPVKLIYFTGKKAENYSQLDWATAIEIDNEKFVVERSGDGVHFEAIGSVKGAGSTTVRQDYLWMDKTPLSGWNYYRLKQVDFDGDFEYTNIVAVNFDGDETAPSIIVYPSPSKDFINVQILGSNQIVEAVLYNMIGQTVKNVTPNERMSVEDLPSGEYFIKVIMGNNVVVKQFVKE